MATGSNTKTCEECPEIMLNTENNNITYGPNDECNCICVIGTIQTNMDTDDNTAVVLLLQNVSLPMTSSFGGSTDCSARIRFPGTNGYECNFANGYCLTFTTEQSICDIKKIDNKLKDFEHDCNSKIPWSELGGRHILYNAGNFAGYKKHFVIQYLVIDCRDPTTTFETTTHEQASTTQMDQHDDESHTNGVASSFTLKESTLNEETLTNRNGTTTNRNGTAANDPEQRSNASKTFMNSAMIIIIAASGTGLLLVILFAVLLATRFCKTKNTFTEYSKKNEEETSPNQEHEMIENSIYGETVNDHKPETIINEIYDATPVTEVTNDEPCLYAVVEKKTGDKKQDGEKNLKDEENVTIIEDEPSSVYAVVNKEKK